MYNISPKFIIDSKFFLADTLCKLFNKSTQDRCFPGKLKFAKVITTHKGKSTMNCKNYRPISLPIFSKIMERLMHNRLVSLKNMIFYTVINMASKQENLLNWLLTHYYRVATRPGNPGNPGNVLEFHLGPGNVLEVTKIGPCPGNQRVFHICVLEI